MKYPKQTNDPDLDDRPEEMVQACDRCGKEFPMCVQLVWYEDSDREICDQCFRKEWEAEQESEDE